MIPDKNTSLWTEPPQTILWGKWCIFFWMLLPSSCQVFNVGPHKCLVLFHITFPENLFSRKANPLNILITPHTFLTLHLNGNLSVTSNIFLSPLHLSKCHPAFKVPLKSHLSVEPLLITSESLETLQSCNSQANAMSSLLK